MRKEFNKNQILVFLNKILKITMFSLVMILLNCKAQHSNQQVKKNIEKTFNQEAGRVIQLKKVMQITDVGKNFFFKGIIDIKVSKNHHLFIQEEKKFLMFSKDGEYIRNFYKYGEGPGELNGSISNSLLIDNDIILSSRKILRFDLQGNLIEEINPEIGLYPLIGYYNGNYYGFRQEMGNFQRTSGIYRNKLILCILKNTGEVAKTSISFPFTISYSIGRGTTSIGFISREYSVSENHRFVYFTCTPEYSVSLLDLKKPEILRNFSRKFKRINLKYKKKPSGIDSKYKNDICRPLLFKNKLWVVTSQFDEDKGLLTDVFDQEGKYIDNFYLPIFSINTKERLRYYLPMTISGDFLFTCEQNKEGLFLINKYEIIDR